MKGSSIWKWSY